MLLTPFDPWKSKLCTCPEKLSFNPYTGCDHGCLYCYASSYIINFNNCRAKKNLIYRLKKEASNLTGELVSMSNSSDPYPKLEQKMGLTKKCLEIFAESNCKLQIITKSDLIIRDLDILKIIPCVVSVSVLTINDKKSKMLEPGAPISSRRFKVIEALVKEGIPTTVRIDPVIPFLNDDLTSLVNLIKKLGVLHITCSTYKVKPDNWKRFSQVFPKVANKLKPYYFTEGERFGRSLYLPKNIRYSLMKKTQKLVEQNNLKFGCCREGFKLNSTVCDGSWVIQERN